MQFIDDSLLPECQDKRVVTVTCREAGETLVQLGRAPHRAPGRRGSTLRRVA